MLLKICGLTNATDIQAAEHAGADFLGMVIVPESPRHVSVEMAEELASATTRKSVCVVRNMPLDTLNRLIQRVHPDVVQLHGNETPAYTEQIHGAEVWKAFKLDSLHALETALHFPCAMIVADSGGGTGQTCRWDLAERLARQRPTLLAGGITLENVTEAIERVHPLGIDVSSGVEKTPGVKDHNKIKELAKRIKQ